MPSRKAYVRNYAQERKTAVARGETDAGHNSGDATRHRARRIVEAKVGKAAMHGKDVDHKVHINHGGSNSPKNLRLRSVKSNRADNGHKPGEKK